MRSGDRVLRIVLDVNAIVSGLLWHGPPSKIVNLVLAERVTLVVSRELLVELLDVLSRKKFEKELGRTGRTAHEWVSEIEEIAVVADSIVIERTSRDPDDDAILAAALSSRADFIVTGDQDLLVLKSFRDIPILTPAYFLAWNLLE